jgi:hypothetical protein
MIADDDARIEKIDSAGALATNDRFFEIVMARKGPPKSPRNGLAGGVGLD